MPTAPIIEHLAQALDVAPGALFEEPALAGKVEASETGPTEAEQQHPSLDQVREVFAPLADGLNRYCARWEEKLPTLQGTPEEVADFVADAQDFRGFFTHVAAEELYAIAEALDLENRYGDNSGLPRDMAVGFTRGSVEEHSLMHRALQRYYAVGNALAESIKDEKAAESMRQVLSPLGA